MPLSSAYIQLSPSEVQSSLKCPTVVILNILLLQNLERALSYSYSPVRVGNISTIEQGLM